MDGDNLPILGEGLRGGDELVLEDEEIDLQVGQLAVEDELVQPNGLARGRVEQERRQSIEVVALLAYIAHDKESHVGLLRDGLGDGGEVTVELAGPDGRYGILDADGFVALLGDSHAFVYGQLGFEFFATPLARCLEALAPRFVVRDAHLNVVVAGEHAFERQRGLALKDAVEVDAAFDGAGDTDGAGLGRAEARLEHLGRVLDAARELPGVKDKVGPQDDDLGQRVLAVVVIAGSEVCDGELQEALHHLVVIDELHVVLFVEAERALQRFDRRAVALLLDVFFTLPQGLVRVGELTGRLRDGLCLRHDFSRLVERLWTNDGQAAAHAEQCLRVVLDALVDDVADDFAFLNWDEHDPRRVAAFCLRRLCHSRNGCPQCGVEEQRDRQARCRTPPSESSTPTHHGTSAP